MRVIQGSKTKKLGQARRDRRFLGIEMQREREREREERERGESGAMRREEEKREETSERREKK